jgi:NAD dependent epimerase/dehydratase family enzyme
LPTGPLNATAPNPVSNRDFAKALGRALHRPSFMPTPGFMLRLMLGEAADVVITGQRVLPKRALALGYAFKYPTVDAALAQILG